MTAPLRPAVPMRVPRDPWRQRHKAAGAARRHPPYFGDRPLRAASNRLMCWTATWGS
jgi:hypothetical protein